MAVILINMMWIFALIFAAVSGYLAFFMYRSQVMKFAPEAKVLIEARKKNAPVAIVHERRNIHFLVPPFIEGLYHITTKKRNFGLVWDMRQDPDKIESGINGLRFFNCYVNHSSAITGAEAKAIADIQQQKPVDIPDVVFWECLRMNDEQLRDNYKVLDFKTEEELKSIIDYKNKYIKRDVPPSPGIFSFEEAMRVVNPGQAAGLVLALKEAWKKAGALDSLSKFDAKMLITAGIAFAAIAIGGAVAYTMIT